MNSKERSDYRWVYLSFVLSYVFTALISSGLGYYHYVIKKMAWRQGLYTVILIFFDVPSILTLLIFQFQLAKSKNRQNAVIERSIFNDEEFL